MDDILDDHHFSTLSAEIVLQFNYKMRLLDSTVWITNDLPQNTEYGKEKEGKFDKVRKFDISMENWILEIDDGKKEPPVRHVYVTRLEDHLLVFMSVFSESTLWIGLWKLRLPGLSNYCLFMGNSKRKTIRKNSKYHRAP